MAPPATPTITVVNRQRSRRVDRGALEILGTQALPMCLDRSGAGNAPLAGLESVEVTLVSDRKIAQLHVRFMGIPGPTDVITFEHGEIVISADTAERQGREHGQEFSRELFRYVVHGLLHLNGHEDATAIGAGTMWKAQEKIVAKIWGEMNGSRGIPAAVHEARR